MEGNQMADTEEDEIKNIPELVVYGRAHELRKNLHKYATKYPEYLTKPIGQCNDIGNVQNFIPLFLWGYLNPFGPTACSLMLIKVPTKDEYLIALRKLNPFIADCILFGIIPVEVSKNKTELLSVLHSLFGKNGEEDYKIFGDFPSHIIGLENFIGDPPLPYFNSKELREVFWSASTSLPNDAIEDIEERCRTLELYKGDPWRRVNYHLSIQLSGNQTDAKNKKDICVKLEREMFNKWFDLVTDSIHVKSELEQMPIAWDGSIKLQEKYNK